MNSHTMNSHTTPRQDLQTAHRAAKDAQTTRDHARRAYHGTLDQLIQLQDRLQRVEIQLAHDTAALQDAEHDAYNADANYQIANARHIATRTAARRRALLGWPSIKPCGPWTTPPRFAFVRMPSKCQRFPFGSTPRNALVERAWARRRLWQRMNEGSPAARVAMDNYTELMNAAARRRAYTSREHAIAYGME